MKKLLILVMVAIGFCHAAHAGPVTWSFFETSIISCNNPPSCMLPPQPFVLMTLTLPGPTSTGTGVWGGDAFPALPPVYTGDSFALSVQETGLILTSAFTGDASNPGGLRCDQSISPRTICSFLISWSEAAGNLTALRIDLLTASNNIGMPTFGLTGGGLGADGTLGGCAATQCVVAGFWQSDLAIPEPMSVTMLLTALLGTCFASLKKWTSWRDLTKSAAR